MHNPTSGELPMGFSMALAKNPAALEAFSAMSPQERRMVVEGTHNVHSAAEMRQYVASLQGSQY